MSIEEKLKIQEKKKYYGILLKTYKTVLRDSDVFFSDFLFGLLLLYIHHNSLSKTLAAVDTNLQPIGFKSKEGQERLMS